MSDDGGVTPAQCGCKRVAPNGVTPAPGKGALGKWRAPYRKHPPDSEPDQGDNLNGRRAGGITTQPSGVCERALEPRAAWEGPLGKCCCCQPDSGNPTVRDERGAPGNVTAAVRAPGFYPTVAADKAAIQWVQVPPCQLPETDT